MDFILNKSALHITSSINQLHITINKETKLNFFHYFMISMFLMAHVMIALFIFYSIRNDGITAIKILFVIIGILMLLAVNRQLREILIFTRGTEDIKINNNIFQYAGKLGPIKKNVFLNLNDIRKFDLSVLGTGRLAVSSNMYAQIKYGLIFIGKSNRNKLAIGQSLNKEELEKLYNELRVRIKLPERISSTI